MKTILQDRSGCRFTTFKLKNFSCFVTSILARENSFSGSTFLRFSRKVEELLRIFLRQDFTLPCFHGSVSCTSLVQNFDRKIKFLWVLWLLSAGFLTSNYNAVFNANYIIEPEYSRNWTKGLLGMGGFNIILAFDDPPLDYVGEFLIQHHYLNGTDCYEFYELVTGRDWRQTCLFVYEYVEMKENRFKELLHKNREKRIKFHTSQIHLVPIELLKHAIYARLTMSKTVFVSPREYLHSDWALFREQMRHNKALKFSWHFDKGGTGLRAVTSYGITKGLHQWHYNLVPRRLKTIVSNGILGLWREWANLRLKFRASRNAALTRPNISCRCRYAALTSTSYFCYLYYVCRYVLVRFYLKSVSDSNLAPNKYFSGGNFKDLVLYIVSNRPSSN